MTLDELEALVNALALGSISWSPAQENCEYRQARNLLWRHVRKQRLERELAELTTKPEQL